MPVAVPGLNTYVYNQTKALGKMAQILRLQGKADMWQRKAHALARRMIERLHSPALWGAHPLATVARDDPHYDANQMWRGPVWINL